MPNVRITVRELSEIPQLYMHREDKDVFGFLRGCAYTGGCPAVFVLNEPNTKVEITKDWQFYLVAINYKMEPQKVMAQLGYSRAFCNNTGFGDTTDPRANYINGTNLRNKPPQFDKDRTCSRSILSGVEVGNNLKLTMFNGNNPPPMKPGKRHPQTLGEINIDDYLYNPREHRWMFFAANLVSFKGGNNSVIVPFDGGAVYEWLDEDPYIWIPHVSDEVILYPRSNLIKLPKDSPLPSPYRRLD